jgi:hypothetical protein
MLILTVSYDMRQLFEFVTRAALRMPGSGERDEVNKN